MEKEQFVQLILEAEPTLFHIAYSILHDEQDCADAVSEAVVKAYANKDSLRETQYFKTWIVRIVINECYAFLRKQKKFREVPEEFMKNIEDSHPFVKEEYLDLYAAIEKLRGKDKICVLLYYMEDYSVHQISQILKIPEGTVKSRLKRARAALKGMLDT